MTGRENGLYSMWAAGVDGLKGLKLGRYKNKTQGFSLEVKWPRLGIYSGREGHKSYGSHAVCILEQIASSTRVDITACDLAHGCVCLVVGGTALVKMTQPIWHPDHLPNLRLGANNRDICHPGSAKLSPFPLKALPRFGRSAHFGQGIVAHHGSTEALEGASFRVVGMPGSIWSQLPATGCDGPLLPTTTGGAQREGAGGSIVPWAAGVVGQWDWPGIRR